jgi:large subunit ribosomal protein L25
MQTTIEATPITLAPGKGAARKLRASGKVPAVIYAGGQAAQRVSVTAKAVTDAFDKSKNRNMVLHVQVGSASFPCIVREAQRHPVSREIIHFDFMDVTADQPIEALVPLLPTGKAKGLGAGGRLRIVRRELKVAGPASRIPATLEIDVSDLDIGDDVRVSKVATPEGIRVIFDVDFAVFAVDGKKEG